MEGDVAPYALRTRGLAKAPAVSIRVFGVTTSTALSAHTRYQVWRISCIARLAIPYLHIRPAALQSSQDYSHICHLECSGCQTIPRWTRLRTLTSSLTFTPSSVTTINCISTAYWRLQQ